MEKLFKLSKEKIRLYDDVLSILFPVGFPLSIDILNIRLKSKLPKLTDDEIKSILQSLKLLGIIDITQPKEVFITPEWMSILQKHENISQYIKSEKKNLFLNRQLPVIAVLVTIFGIFYPYESKDLQEEAQKPILKQSEEDIDTLLLKDSILIHKKSLSVEHTQSKMLRQAAPKDSLVK